MMGSSNTIEAQTVYNFTGNPSPDFMKRIMDRLFNEPLSQAQNSIGSELKEMGIALESILKSIYMNILECKMPSEQKTFLVNRIGDIEYRLSLGCQESMALASLTGAFTEIRYVNST